MEHPATMASVLIGLEQGKTGFQYPALSGNSLIDHEPNTIFQANKAVNVDGLAQNPSDSLLLCKICAKNKH